MRWSGLPPKKHLPFSWLRKTRLRSMDRGSGRRRLDAPLDCSRADAFVLQENGRLRCPAGASLWLSEVRQENAFTQRAVYLAYQTDCQCCSLREQCLASGAKGDRARRESRVRRLLPSPAEVSRKPLLLGSMRWMWLVERFAASGRPIGVGNTLRSFPWVPRDAQRAVRLE